MMHGAIGEASNVVTLGNFTHNRPPVAKDEYIAAIHGWIAEKRDALSREEIGKMEAFDRVDAHRKAYLIGLSQYYRDNPRADVAPGVFAIVTFLSDNEAGVCTVAQANIGKVLGRSRTAIAEASARLTKSGLIEVTPKRAISSPVIPRAVTASYNHLAWLIEALAADVPSKGHDDVPSSRHQMSRQADMSEQTCPVEADQHVPSTGHNFTKENSIRSDQGRAGEKSEASRLKAAAAALAATVAAVTPLAAADSPPTSPPAILRAAVDLDALQAALLDAGGKAMANPANCPGLIMMGEPQKWLAQGCDLQLDILPTIRACVARMQPGSIKHWGYFTQAVANAKHARSAPMPAAEPRAAPAKSWAEQRQESANDWLYADLANRERKGRMRPRIEEEQA